MWISFIVCSVNYLHFRIECLSDAALKDSEHETQYQDEYGRVVYADASVGWLYKGQNDSDFKPIDDEIR